MSRFVASRDYRCLNDCTPGGCPGHTMKVAYQTTSDTFHFESAGGSPLQGSIYMDLCEFEAMQDLIQALFEWDDSLTKYVPSSALVNRERH